MSKKYLHLFVGADALRHKVVSGFVHSRRIGGAVESHDLYEFVTVCFDAVVARTCIKVRK